MQKNKLALLLILFLTNLVWSLEPPSRSLVDQAYRTSAKTDRAFARCRLDLYLPPGTNFPTLVWFHGGALEKGERNDVMTRQIAEAFVAKGIAVAAASYRLSPATTFPGYVDDAAAAFAYVQKTIATYGGNANQVFIGGHSAGGYLAYMVTLDLSYLKKYDLKEDAIAGVIPVSGQTITHKTVRKERGLPQVGVVVDSASPLHYLREKTPPFLVLAAEKDLPARLEENRLFVAASQEIGNKSVTYYYAADRTHLSIAGDMAKEKDPVAQVVADFIHRIAAQRQ